MIINGNYKYFDMNELKPKLIEAFVEYYGEEYRDLLTEKINNIEYHPYHSYNYVIDYYDNYMFKLKDKIAEKFFELAGIERTPIRAKLILPKSADYLSGITFAVEGGLDVNNNIRFSEEGKRESLTLRNKIIKEFGLKGTEKEIWNQLLHLKELYNQAESYVEDKYTCDVVEDMKLLESNHIDSLRYYLKCAKNAGFDLSFEDIALVSRDDFQLNYMYKLDCYKKLFGVDITCPGILNSFTTESNEILKNGNQTQKVNIITDRLKYLANQQVSLQLITEDDLYNTSDDPNFIDKLFKEYEYQKKAQQIPSTVDYWGYNIYQIRKNFSKGEFFPSKFADELEDLRKTCCYGIYSNCKFNENATILPHIDTQCDFITLYSYKNGNINKPYSEVYINEDQVFNEDSFLNILIHETNHAISHSIPLKRRKNDFIAKMGLSKRIYNNQNTHTDSDPKYINFTLQKLDENVNERQSKEIKKILKRQSKINLHFDEDSVMTKRKDKFICSYNYYNFLTDEFYYRYYDLLKAIRVNPDYDIFFKHDLPITTQDKILSYIKNKFNRIFNSKEYASTGRLDFYKVCELAELIEEFEKNVMPHLLYYINEDKIKYGDIASLRKLEFLDPRVVREIMKLKEKKDRLLQSMIKDEDRAQEIKTLPTDEFMERLQARLEEIEEKSK